MQVLVTGADGQLGRSLQAIAHTTGHVFDFAPRQILDISDHEAVKRYFDPRQIRYCINTAAYTQVDRAEEDSTQAHLLNTRAPEHLAAICHDHGCVLIHLSTDYVYHNALRRPLREDDPTHPVSVYAKTKLAGELRAMAANPETIVVRTSWLFSKYGHNFVKTMARLMRDGRPLRVVDDQTGCPTYAGDLAGALLRIIDTLDAGVISRPFGVYNYCNEGMTTWYGFANAIASHLGLDVQITPVHSAEYGAPAPRPGYSVLDTTKIRSAFGLQIPHWSEGLTKALLSQSL